MLRTFFVAFMLIGLVVVNAYSQNRLLQESDLVYLGAFRGPNYWGGSDCNSLAYGGGSMAYNHHNDSLFVSSMCNKVTEITIPTPVKSSDLNSLPRAALLTPSPHYFEPTEGNRNRLGEGGAAISGSVNNRGLLVFGNKLVGTSKIYFDAAYQQRLTHYTHSLDLSESSFQGHFELDVNIFKGILPGYLGLIPAEYQDELGGTAITGMGFGSIATATSYGPSATVFNPADLGVVNPAPATPLLYYTSDHPMAGNRAYFYDNDQPANPYTSTADSVSGVVFPSGTRTVMFFGSHGLTTDGYCCYGAGVSTLEQAYTSGPPYLKENRRRTCGEGRNEYCCYDPDSSGKGVHSYPYVNQIWAYDVNDLIAVKNGSKKPWEPIPYAVWNPVLPTKGRQFASAAYDPATRRIFVAQAFADGTSPVFHVFRVAGTPSDHSCSDGIKNGNETGVDCGGDCAPCLKPPTNVRSVKVTP